MRFCALLLAGCAAPAIAPPPAPPPADTDLERRIDRCVLTLGSNSIDERDEAERELLAIGETLIPRLKALVDRSDGERKARAKAILDKLTGDAPLPVAMSSEIARWLRHSPRGWKADVEKLFDDAMTVAPKATIDLLFHHFGSEERATALMGESQMWTVGMVAGTALEKLLCRGVTSIAWWNERKSKPASALFAGLSWPDARDLRAILHRPLRSWHEATSIGLRAAPFLLELLDNLEWSSYDSTAQSRWCDAANRMLRLLSGEAFGEIALYEPTNYDPRDPMRNAAQKLVAESQAAIKAKWLAWWSQKPR